MFAWSWVRIITMSTMREITRATSSTGSPRASWVSPMFSTMDAPPSWKMPASNETRVRVELFSKTIASMRSTSGWYAT